MVEIHIKRIYEQAAPDDGFRVLVDRIWPRGLSKEKAAIDLWEKEIAPSTELRKWFGHDPARWDAFEEKYREELAHNTLLLQELLESARGKTLTLLFGARDEDHNQAVVLRDYLKELSS